MVEKAQKFCEFCGSALMRRRDLSHRQWRDTRFCSRVCAAKVIRKPKDPLETFWSNILPEPNSGCWLWIGTLNAYGYGVFMAGGEHRFAHRFSLELHKGSPSLDGLNGLHHCDNPSCVNPDHLYWGTSQDNADDAVRRDRQISGERHHQSKLTEIDVKRIRASNATTAALANIYDVSTVTIRKIRARIAWRHVA